MKISSIIKSKYKLTQMTTNKSRGSTPLDPLKAKVSFTLS